MEPGSRAGVPEPPVSPAELEAARAKAAGLTQAAEAMASRAKTLHDAAVRRRGGPGVSGGQADIWKETQRTLREMEAHSRQLQRESELLEREVTEQAAWVRERVVSMLDAGWTREELAEVGIRDELLASLHLLDDPRLREGGEAGREAADAR